ncbi:unnamed protein product [Adineta steineri]|uniref:Uncharacterized protein n=1 Tax=Adineta steineri TaxID=433720 RepID=A0A819P3G7_9BILA|nr:unnamed protein product [Adineta steineri]
MVVLKPQPNAPLETIYEESGSFNTSLVSMHHPLHNHIYNTQGTINGLISARSIPPVNFYKQRAATGNQHKPPIEVRFRDGSKRFIHPGKTATMIINRRNVINSSNKNLSSKTISHLKPPQIYNSHRNKENIQSRPHSIVLTIITANDLKRIGLTPTDSSSPDTSTTPMSTPSAPKMMANQSQSILTQSISTSTMGTMKSRKSNFKVSFAPLPPMTPIQTTSNSSTSTNQTASILSHLSSQEQSNSMSDSQNTTVSQSISTNNTNPTLSLPNSKASIPSSQIVSSTGKNEKNTSPNANKSQKQIPQPNTTVHIGGGSHSAFRPFLKRMHFSPKTIPIAMRTSLAINGTTYQPPQQQQQQQQMIPYTQFRKQQFSAIPSSHITKIPVKTISTQNENLSNYRQQQSIIANNNNINIINNALNLRNVLNISSKPGNTFSLALKPNTHWYNIASNHITDIPRLAQAYASIPLRITLPVVTPTHNQKLLVKHNIGLEQRLLNAGLSPETIALYERILDVAENRPTSLLSPPKIIDQNPYRSLL